MTEPTEKKGSIHSDMEHGGRRGYSRTEGTVVTNDGHQGRERRGSGMEGLQP